MITIQKRQPPSSLTGYKQQSDACYDGQNFTQVKSDIRTSLLQEQGYLCAYCLTRLYDDRSQTKVEHWHCQDKYPSEQLDYRNLLAVCRGNERQPPNNQHCDTKKANQDLNYNPANQEHRIETKIRYHRDGTLESDDPEFNKQINDVLNLNFSRLKRNREEALDAVIERLKNPKSKPDRILKLHSESANGKKVEYCGIVIFYIEMKINKSAK